MRLENSLYIEADQYRQAILRQKQKKIFFLNFILEYKLVIQFVSIILKFSI